LIIRARLVDMLHMELLKIAAAGLLIFPTAVVARGGGTDEQAIRTVLNRFTEAWNRHDAKAFAAVFAEDADCTNWRGDSAKGRAGIEAMHAPSFGTIFKHSHQEHTDIKIRFIRPDVAAVDVRWKMTGQTDPQGNPRPEREGLLSFVMASKADQWQIVVMHNLDVSALPSPPK
jgi:uncharacterized protein (TIGR02246 family)